MAKALIYIWYKLGGIMKCGVEDLNSAQSYLKQRWSTTSISLLKNEPNIWWVTPDLSALYGYETKWMNEQSKKKSRTVSC